MKKFLMVAMLFAAVVGLGDKAQAYESIYTKGFSTFTVTGVVCTTGTAVNVTQRISGYNLGGLRIQNQDTNAAWIGFNSSVSTTTTTGANRTNLGERLDAGANGVWAIDYNSDDRVQVKTWCKAADAASAAAVSLSITAFGYK